MAQEADRSDYHTSEEQAQPLALLLCSDLMFAVQLQAIARKAGYTFKTVRPGADIGGGDVLVVELSHRDDWEEAIRQAANSMPVIAFGPHTDVEARRKAKAAGATRLLANSNLASELPVILRTLKVTDEGRRTKVD